MSKYSSLGDYLRMQKLDEVPLTFVDIEKIIGMKLPRSAFEYRPWWSNNASNSVMTKIWLDAGFRTEQVDMAGKKLVFKRVTRAARDFSEDAKTHAFAPASAESGSAQHPMIGALKGLLKIAPGVDLTEPADPGWGAAAWGDDSRP